VRGHDDRPRIEPWSEGLRQRGLPAGVEMGCWLIQEEDGCLPQDGPRDGDPLTLTGTQCESAWGRREMSSSSPDRLTALKKAESSASTSPNRMLSAIVPLIR